MNGSGRTIAKNMGAMMASQLVTWSLSFILAIFLPRYLGASVLGEIAVANSIWAIAGVLISFGMDTHLTKMVARNPEHTSSLLGTSLAIRTLFFFIASIAVGVYLYTIKLDPRIAYIAMIVGASTLLGSYGSTLMAVVIGLERMEINSFAGIINKTLLTLVTLTLIFMNASVYAIVAASLFTGIISMAITIHVLKSQVQLHLRVNLNEAKAMLRASAPYLVTALALVIYQQIDQLLIAAMVDTRAVGWYGTAMTLFGTTMFVPVVIGTALLPALSRTYASSQDQLHQIARRSFDLMFLISIPIGLGTVIIANPIVVLLYGPEFAQSGPILAVLGVVLIFTYLNTLLGQLLISTDRTSKWNLVMIGGIALTLPLDLVLIPWTHNTFGNGALGGTVAFLFTEFVMVASAILLLPKGTIQWSNVRNASLTLFAGLVMVATSWWWRDTMLPLSILVGAITYIGLVFLLRIIPPQDLKLLQDVAIQILHRIRRTQPAAASPSSD